ncbi:MAG: glycosyltransferase family 4 protein [Prolixibacteraceae bacterium]|nr:glycosyltransferase family 4 protein [Prolixibacteraceae bacterium]
MKVAFVIPFAFERFFHDAKALFSYPEKFEDEIISKRNTWHFNWANALSLSGNEVIFIHISLFGKKVREYKHINGIKIIRVPTTYRRSKLQSEFSVSLLRVISKISPDVLFSVTHVLPGIIDMYDVLSFFSKRKGIFIVARNPGADTFNCIFEKRNILSSKLKAASSSHRYYYKIQLYLYLLYTSFEANLKLFVKSQSLRLASFIIPQTHVDYNGLHSKLKVDKKKLIMLPKPVDLSIFYDMDKIKAFRETNLNPENRYILHVSNLFNTKGCELIISMLPELIGKYNDIILLVAGGGMKMVELQSLSVSLGVEEHVIFLGHIDHSRLVYYYNVADVFVLPTQIPNEGIPNVILESIACNTPPVSTNLPGPSEILKDGLGLLININDKEELIHAIEQVLDREFVIDEVKRREFLNSYNLKSVGEELNKLINKLTFN